MRRRNVFALAACFFVVLGLYGCGTKDSELPGPNGGKDPNGGQGCETDGDCPGPGRCWDGECGPMCRDEDDCEPLEQCTDGLCEPSPDVECSSDLDCLDPVSVKCAEGFCARRPCGERGFVIVAPSSFDTVHISGTFNGWPSSVAAGGLELQLIGDAADRTWYGVAHAFPEGRHIYKVVGTTSDVTTWWHDHANPLREEDGHGGYNSVFQVQCASQCGDETSFDWRDTVKYHVLVDRFFSSDGIAHPVAGATGEMHHGASAQYEGGDLAGITEKLPYLEELGINSLWLSPPLENRDEPGAAMEPNADPHMYSAYHGLWPSPDDIDYSDPDNPSPRPRVEWRIGSETDLKDLVESAQSRGMTVLIDYVMNHVDENSGLFQANPSWFSDMRLCEAENLWDDPHWRTRCSFTSYLPAFAFEESEDARSWSINDVRWWAQELGIDGLGLRWINHVPTVWLEDLRVSMNETFDSPLGGRFYLVGDTASHDNQAALQSIINPSTMLDGQLDYPARRYICEAVLLPESQTDVAAFAEAIAMNYARQHPDALMTTLFGHPEMPRPIHLASGQLTDCRQGSTPDIGWTSHFPQPEERAPYERLALAFAIMMTSPGVPMIYYGDEVGLAGGGDPDNRRVMPWHGLNEHQLTLREKVSELVHIRKENKVLSRGRQELVSVHAEEGWMVYRMTGCSSGSRDVVVAINRTGQQRSVAIPVLRYVNLRTGEAVQGGVHVLPAKNYLILREEVEGP